MQILYKIALIHSADSHMNHALFIMLKMTTSYFLPLANLCYPVFTCVCLHKQLALQLLMTVKLCQTVKYCAFSRQRKKSFFMS